MITQKQIDKLDKKIIIAKKEGGASFCPACGSKNVTGDGAFIGINAGAMICKDCGNRDIAFPKSIAKLKKRGKS
ncbi:MAG TPA: hypothetical protein VJK03_02920 [Candidatus Nanoarchaeia archaeon]|nr:hypothetical protein [Candidatus Nanoarchaeia archaeon]